MQTFHDKQLTEFVEQIQTKNNNVSLFLIALLFSIGLHITWLIYVFSILLVISLVKYLNNKFEFLSIKFKK